MSIKNYTEEFKREAVKQISERGYSQADVARRLGVNRKTMCAWVKRYEKDWGQVFQCNGGKGDEFVFRKSLLID